MTQTNYKKKSEVLKSQLSVDNKIEKHKQKYIHIPFSWSGIGKFALLIGLCILSYLNFILIISIGNEYKVWELLGSSPNEEVYTSFTQLIILYPIIGEYALIGLTIISCVALFKGGFNNIKKYSEDPLIYGLIVGLIGGLIGGLIYGLIYGLIVGLIGGLIYGLIFGLIVGLIVGLIFGSGYGSGDGSG